MKPLKVWNYGGGVQSIAIACMVRGGLLPKPDVAIFADTEDERQETYDWLEFMRPLLPCELRIVSAGRGSLRDHVRGKIKAKKRLDKPPLWTLGKDGKEAPIGRDCTREFKIVPIRREVKRLLGLNPKARWPKELAVEQWLGISGDEKSRMKVSTDAWMRWWHPLIEEEWSGSFWAPKIKKYATTREMCHSIITTTIREEGWNPPTVDAPYSACSHCPFQSNKRWRRVRDTEPEEWRKNVEYDREIRVHGVHGMKNKCYLHRSLVPLDEVDLDSEMGSSFDEECAGICGV
jgi:hypothetical protein